ncbi:MAG: GatB/YqeY domain-containing protein [Wenzhouxiangella sp.]|nr:GatB/YqeY domain-containing protein [Wenzhouxiangella sp.]
MSIQDRLGQDIKNAMKSGEKARLKTLRMASAAIKQKEVDERIELDETQTLAIIEKMVKQRRDSIEQYTEGNRPELAEVEQAEIDILQAYLPEPLSQAELDALIDEAIGQLEAPSMAAMGQVMAAIKPQVQGRADMKAVSGVVKDRLSAAAAASAG